MGSWKSIYDRQPKDVIKNAVVKAQLYAEKSRNNLIKTDTDKKVVISGLENFIIVDSDGLLMICPMYKNQEAKNLAEKPSKHFDQKEG